MLISRAPTNSCTLIYKSLIGKGGSWYFHFLLYKKDMTVCWWYYPFPHSCISRLSGRQYGGCQCWVLKAVFLFTHQNIENISSNELSLPLKKKDPSCHSEQHIPHSCLPTVWWADARMIMPSRGLVSLQRAVLLPLSRTHHILSLSEVKNKASPWNRWCRSFSLWYKTWLSDTDRARSSCISWSYLKVFISSLHVCSHLHRRNPPSNVQNVHKFVPLLMLCRSTDSFCSL